MNEPETNKEESASSVEDLPVTQEQAEEAKGGLTLNYQKFHVTYLEQDHQ